MSGTREASHAGSWYSSSSEFPRRKHPDPTIRYGRGAAPLPPSSSSYLLFHLRSPGESSELEAELSKNLSKVTPLLDLNFDPPIANSRAIIAPHAGYSYSGGAAAWAYASIPTEKIKKVFLLGPSHHAYIPGVALSSFAKYGTPLGDIPLCLDTVEALRKTGIFQKMNPEVDEDEHSLEMHLPYIRHVFKGRDDLRLVPILVGQPTAETGIKLAQVLEPYFRDQSNYFIISSDFCHWGTRFQCTPYYPNAPPTPNAVPPIPAHTQPAAFEPPELVKKYSSSVARKETPIWQSIEYMDHEGMDLLRQPGGFGAVEKWEAYLARTKNTVCGRNPITVLLRLLTHVAQVDGQDDYEFVFVRYEQSSRCMSGSDSSVSYVSGILRPKGKA